MKKIFAIWLVFILLVSLLAACGNFNYGVVKDVDGQPIEDAVVRVDNQEVTTNSEGYFSLRNLAEGDITIEIEKEGYHREVVQYTSENHSEAIGEITLNPID